VKTRIAATAGAERAAEIYRELVARVCAQLPLETPVIVYFDPPERRADIEAWLAPKLPQSSTFEPQVRGDLGARLQAAFASAFAAGWDHAAVIGSDCVEITPAIFSEAWDAEDAAIGPTEDGGYYLLALRREQPALFENIRWSTSETLADTLAQAKAASIRMHQLPTLNDVDTESDWMRVSAGS
jgi:rSAM/selenodomain-associated transferase 1